MFKVGLTRDFLTTDGRLNYKDIGLDILDREDGVEYEFLKEYGSPITPDMIQGYNAIISLAPVFDSNSFIGVDGLRVICRFGVGYDMVDLKACSDSNIIVTITKGAVNYSVAESVVTWMLALCHRVFEKDKLVRNGGWGNRSLYMGNELQGRTLGIVGMGGIGGKLVEMLRPFNMGQVIAFDPYIGVDKALQYGVQLVELDYLMQHADFISINCPLTTETLNLIGERELLLVKKEAYIINTARGGIINEKAIIKLLTNNLIGGYATDVFANEPPSSDDLLFKLDNVIVAPHCIAWTHDLFKEIGEKACQQVVQVARGEIPENVINPDILDQWQRSLINFKKISNN